MIRYAQVTPRLPVHDLQRTIEFYSTILGFAVDVLWPDSRPTFVIMTRDNTSVGFYEPNEHQGPPGYAELYIEVTSATALYDRLCPRTTIEWGPEVYSYGRREFALRDPEGYLIIFTEPTDDQPTTHEPD